MDKFVKITPIKTIETVLQQFTHARIKQPLPKNIETSVEYNENELLNWKV